MKSLKFLIVLLATSIAPWVIATSAHAASANELDRDAREALRQLYLHNPKAKEIAYRACAVLVFPTVVKAGFILGAQGGDGPLISSGGTVGYYHTGAVSYGLQAGVQKFSYALFFINPQALSYLRKSGGWEIGVGPSIVVVDTGAAKTLSSTTLQNDIYAFIFSQKGLMAGLGLQGTKITPYRPSR
jgi:lipid-binding SYLF domain-containing protein